MREAFLVAIAGAFGALGRYGVSVWARRAWGEDFPWGTLIVNAVGSVLLGVVLGLSLASKLPRDAKLALGTGFMGAFTTFSTFSCDTVSLIDRGHTAAAAGNVVSNVALGLVGAWLGFAAVRAIA